MVGGLIIFLMLIILWPKTLLMIPLDWSNCLEPIEIIAQRKPIVEVALSMSKYLLVPGAIQ